MPYIKDSLVLPVSVNHILLPLYPKMEDCMNSMALKKAQSTTENALLNNF